MLVRAISQKPLLGISPNLVCICVLLSFQHLLIVSDLDLHLQGHSTFKYFKFNYFFTYMVDHGVIFSSMAFKLCANRVHIGMLNISSGFFEIQKFKILTEFWRFSHFDSDSRDFHTIGGALIGNMRVRTLGDLPGQLGQWAEPIFLVLEAGSL